MRFDAAGLASRMACPLLVIHGTEDHLASEADMAAIAGANPQAERESFDGADHLEPMASEPERYAQRLTDFIRRCGGTSPG
jgi:pimeloyl-ACP methyl ester carboxylesterase